MLFEVMEMGEGVELSGPNGSIDVYLEPTTDEGQIHVGKDGDGVKSEHLPITGDTYNKKDRIKDVGYGHNGVEWTGEVWSVHQDKVTELVSVLMIAGCHVTVDARAVAVDEDWGILREEVEIGDDGKESIRVMVGPEGEGDEVSRSWCEEAAKVGNYEDAELFAEDFGLEVVDDEVVKERYGLTTDDPEVEVFSSEKAQ